MKLNNTSISIIVGLLILLITAIAIDFTTSRTVLAFYLVFILPVYSILSNFDLGRDEKFFFSLFIGLGLFPLAVYYLNMIIPSFKISIIASFVILVAIGFVLKGKKFSFGK
ncbi:MAG: hypothetical protein GY861_08830 [bacterium]|nr:hypothetical protein [bacterium]